MIFDGGMMGVYFPFNLFWVEGGNVYKYAGDGNVQLTSAGTAQLLRCDIGGSVLVYSVTGGDVNKYNMTNRTFSLWGNWDFTKIEAHAGTIKFYGSDQETWMLNNTKLVDISLEPGAANVISRDAENYEHLSGYLKKKATSNIWENLAAMATNPGRVQKYGSAYYYASGNLLKNLTGTVATLGANIIDFYIDNVSVILTTAGVVWLDSSWNVIDDQELTGITSNSTITMAGSYMAINLSNRIAVLKGYAVAYEIGAVTNFVGIISND